MSGSEFAALLNSSITDSSMKKIFAAVDEALTAQTGRDFVQQNYYEGNKLSGWTVKNGTVTFGENQSQPSQPSVPAVPPASEVQKPEKNNLMCFLLVFDKVETQGSVLYVRRLKRLKTLKCSLKKTQKTF